MIDTALNPAPRYFPHNNDNPMYGMDAMVRALVHDPESLGASVVTIKRNNAVCKSIKQCTFVFDGSGPIPVSTLRQVFCVTGIKEFLCYTRGYTNIKQFQSVGVKTWDKDYHENVSWQNNPNNKGDGDIGQIYFALARNLIGPNGEKKDTLAETIQLLREGNYNRRNIINYFDPFVRGALPPCLYEHALTVHNGYLNLTSTQRSCDSSIGGSFNALQCYFFLHLVCKLVGLKPGWLEYHVHDLHIYEDQIDAIKEYIDNEPLPATGVLTISEKINTSTTLEELDAMDMSEIFSITGYQSHKKYEIPVTV